MPEPLAWERDGAAWPLAAASRFVDAGGVRFHVQRLGPLGAPGILLLHGTGASTHSWRGLAPLLAADHDLLAMDFPGHGFSSTPALDGMSLPGMAASIAALLGPLGFAPRLVVGHSAGAAVGARMVLDRTIAPHALVALNGAMLPLQGAIGQMFAPLARLLVLNSVTPRVFAWWARDERVLAQLLQNTGSTLDADGVALYGRLVGDPKHVHAALAMMAQWELEPMVAALARFPVPLHLVVGGNDRTVPPSLAERIAAIVPAARLHRLPGLGHLAHEERPDLVAALVRAAIAG